MVKKCLFLLVLVACALPCRAQWSVIFSDTTDWQIYDIEFLNADTGFAVGTIDENQSFILKTLDAGQSWDTLLFSSMRFRSIDFPNSDTGYISVLYGTLSIMRSVDQGASWQMIATGIAPVPNPPWNPNPAQILTSLEFVDGLRGIVNILGTPYYTNDGGVTWNYYSVHTDWPSYPGASVEYGVYAWAGSNKITYSVDSLNTFATALAHANYAATGIDFTPDSVLYLTANGTGIYPTYWFGAIARSDDMGANWIDYHFTDIAEMGELEITPNFLYAVSRAYYNEDIFFIKSIDGGNSWFQQSLDTSFTMPVLEIKLLSCLNDSVCYAAGEGSVFKTSNGGGPLLSQVGFQYTSTENEMNNEKNRVNVYPNPYIDNLTVSFSSNEVIIFEIFNSLGQSMQTGSFKNSTVVNSTNWQTGVYFIRVSDGKGVWNTKLVKE